MNKKRLFIFTIFVLLLFFLMTFAGGSKNNIIATRLVEFVDGFNEETISTQNVEVGKDAIVPDTPYHEDYVFTGWYDYDNHTKEVTQFTRVTENIKVIALYAADINNNGISDDQDTRYTVRFIDTIDNEVINTQSVLIGMNANAPTPRAHEGYNFGGWMGGYTNVRANVDVNSIYNNTVGPMIVLGENNPNNMIVFDEIPEFTATATDRAGNEVDVIITHEVDNEKIGTYIITYTATDSDGNTTSLTSEFEVMKRKLGISIDNKESIYGEKIKDLTYTLKNGKIFADPEIELTKKIGTNVGKYPITGVSKNLNYEVTFIDGTYTITKANYVIDVTVNDDPLTYNGEEQTPIIDGLDKLPKDVIAKVTYDGKEDKPKDADNYEVEVTFTCTDDNYNCPEKVKETITVNKAQISLLAESKESIYGESLKPLTYKVTKGKVFGTDNLNVDLKSSVYNKTNPTLNVGKYNIEITANNNNYDISLENGYYTINRLAIAVPETESSCVPATSRVYTGSEITLANAGEGYTLIGNTGTNAIAYNVTAKLDGNHIWNTATDKESDKTFTCAITKRPITIRANDQNITYGEEIVNGVSQVTISGSGLVDGHSLDAITLTASKTTAGSGLITPKDAIIESLEITNNYKITYVHGTLTIGKLAIAVPETESSCVPATSRVYTGSEITLANAGDGYSVTGNTGTNAIAYTVTAKLDGNHIWNTETDKESDKTFTCAITKRPITVTAGSETKIYDGNSLSKNSCSVTSGSLANGESITCTMTSDSTITVVNTDKTNTIESLVISNEENETTSNYEITKLTGTLRINRPTFTIRFTDRNDQVIAAKEVEYLNTLRYTEDYPTTGYQKEVEYAVGNTVLKFIGWALYDTETKTASETLISSNITVTEDLTIKTRYRTSTSGTTTAYLLAPGLTRPKDGLNDDGKNYIYSISNITFIDETGTMADIIADAYKSSNDEGVYSTSGNIARFLTESSKAKINADSKFNGVEWYVLKYNTGDGWHLDGQIVPSIKPLSTFRYASGTLYISTDKTIKNLKISNSNVNVRQNSSKVEFETTGIVAKYLAGYYLSYNEIISITYNDNVTEKYKYINNVQKNGSFIKQN